MHRQQIWKVAVVVLLACGSQLFGQQGHSKAQADTKGATYTTFDIPGSVEPVPTAVNPAGAISGYYFDGSDLIHSFIRTPDGHITAFDPPGSTCAHMNTCSQSFDINPAGVIIGGYLTACAAGDPPGGCTSHGYMRAPDGTFTTIDVPGSIAGTGASGINPAGTVTGSYSGPGPLGHGYLRHSNGIFTTFVPSGSTYTQADQINPSGTITGIYQDADDLFHGFLRSADGKIVTYDPPVAGFITSNGFTQGTTINSEGVVAGMYCADASCSSYHGFVRAADGSLTTIDGPGNNFGTSVTDINSAGTITGYYIPSDFSAQHGFLRTRDGKFITFDPPGAIITVPTAINSSGVITGLYCDDISCRGFVRTPGARDIDEDVKTVDALHAVPGEVSRSAICRAYLATKGMVGSRPGIKAKLPFNCPSGGIAE